MMMTSEGQEMKVRRVMMTSGGEGQTEDDDFRR